MRIPVIAGNWKMYKTIPEAIDLVRGIESSISFPGQVEVVVGPPFSALYAVIEACRDSYIGVAAQNMHYEEEGAFTGEVSGAFLKDMGCRYVIIGHSERRQYFNETDESVNKKVAKALKYGVIPIMCVGETLPERESDQTFEVIERQLGNGLPAMDSSQAKKLIIAYEPVWAIGTGKTASPEQAEEVHLFIRNFLSKVFGDDVADAIRLQYGGSVKPENAAELMSQPNIDGALVGGASLKADSFARIINTAGSS